MDSAIVVFCGAVVSREEGVTVMNDERLETPKQLAQHVGLSQRQVRRLINDGLLDHVYVGSRIMIPTGAWARYLERSIIRSWPDGTKGRVSSGSASATAITSYGLRTDAAASARLARQIANKLKSSSKNGFGPESAEPAPVIRLKS